MNFIERGGKAMLHLKSVSKYLKFALILFITIQCLSLPHIVNAAAPAISLTEVSQPGSGTGVLSDVKITSTQVILTGWVKVDVNATIEVFELESYEDLGTISNYTPIVSQAISVGGTTKWYTFSVTMDRNESTNDRLYHQFFINLNYADSNNIYTAVNSVADSQLTNWEAVKVLDNDSGTCWSSSQAQSANETRWIYVDLGSSKDIQGVKINPRVLGYCFPVDFKFQYSTDTNTWTDVTGQSYTSYTRPTTPQTFTFSTTVNARYLRLYATKLSTDGGNYYCQIADIYVMNPDHLIDTTKYATTLDNIAANTYAYPAKGSKKGYSMILNMENAQDIGIKSVGLNFTINKYLAKSTSTGDKYTYTIDGETFYFFKDAVDQFDRQVKNYTDMGMYVTMIMYLDPTVEGATYEVPEIRHPDYNMSLGSPALPAPNGINSNVKYLKAAMEFFAERYTRADKAYGRVADFIFGNEWDHSYEWNNMGNKTLDQYTTDWYIQRKRYS